MSQTLTQPEEIDCILQAMAGFAIEPGTSMRDPEPLEGGVCDCVDYMGAADSGYGEGRKKKSAWSDH